MASSIIPTLISFLHELFTIIWIGGMILLVLVILPILKKQYKPDEFKIIYKKIKSRLSIFVYISIIGLLVTGIILTRDSTLSGGFLSFENTYSILLSIKHILFILMAIIAIFRSAVLDRIKGMKKEIKQKSDKILLLTNVVFAVAVLFLSAYTGVLSSIAI